MSDDAYDPMEGYTPPKMAQDRNRVQDPVVMPAEDSGSFWVSRGGIALIGSIYLILGGLMIAFFLNAYYWSTDWITARVYQEYLFYIAFPMPLFLIGFLLAMFKLMKPAFIVFIIAAVLAMLSLNIPSVVCFVACAIIARKISKKKS